MPTFIRVNNGDAIGRGGQGLDQRAQEIRTELTGLMQDMEPARKLWQGQSGTSFEAAKQQLLEKLNAVFTSLQQIAAGLDRSQSHVTESDNTAAGALAGAAGQIGSAFNRPININI